MIQIQCSSARLASILPALFSGIAASGTPVASLFVLFNATTDPNVTPPVKVVSCLTLDGLTIELTDPGMTVSAFESTMTAAGVNLLFQAF